MFRLTMSTTALAITAAGWGCNAIAPASESTLEPGPAVACAKCQTTWVKIPVRGKANRVVAYSPRKEMRCPDCVSAVDNFFKTGNLKHACATCGEDAMKICGAH